jgi:hypothetical protein
MTTVAIHQPQYLPWVPYCDKADACDVFVYLDTVAFQKNGVQNRNRIRTAAGDGWLTVPVHVRRDTRLSDVTIAGQDWGRRHSRALRQGYARAPHAALMADLLPLLERPWTHLVDLDVAVTEWLFDRLGVRSRRLRASSLGPLDGAKTDRLVAICRALGATTYLSGPGARAYLEPERLEAAGIRVRFHEYESRPYRQHDARAFRPDLSAIDLVLSTGPEARATMLAGRRHA